MDCFFLCFLIIFSCCVIFTENLEHFVLPLIFQTGLISHQSISNLQNYDTSNIDQPFQNNFDTNAQSNWVYSDQQYLQPDSKVWQLEQVTRNEYPQQEQQGFQQNGK